MLDRLAWMLPAGFLAIAAINAVEGRTAIASLYVALAAGVALHTLGARQGVRPMQWFGAGVAAFALAILAWAVFGQR